MLPLMDFFIIIYTTHSEETQMRSETKRKEDRFWEFDKQTAEAAMIVVEISK